MTGHGDIEIGDVDGLRAVRAPAPVEGRTFAALWFGSGVLHESVPERGINHLIEHLAFGAVRRLPGAVNAQVSLTGTGFFAEGSEDECVAVLRGGDHTGATPGRFVKGPGWRGR